MTINIKTPEPPSLKATAGLAWLDKDGEVNILVKRHNVLARVCFGVNFNGNGAIPRIIDDEIAEGAGLADNGLTEASQLIDLDITTKTR